MNRLLVLCVLLGVAMASRPASACLVGRQVRVVVLGSSGNAIIALEIEQVRDGDLETGKQWFFVTPRVVSLEMGKDGTVTSRKLVHEWAEKRVKARRVEAWLLRTFDASLKRAKQLRGFAAAVIEKRTECEYLDKCGSYSVVQRGLRGPGKKVFPVVTPTLLANTGRGQIQDFRGAGIGIDTIDLVRAGNHRVAVVTMGNGWDQNPCDHAAGPCVDDRKPQPRPTPKSMRAGLAHRGGLHHGMEWDVLVTR